MEKVVSCPVCGARSRAPCVEPTWGVPVLRSPSREDHKARGMQRNDGDVRELVRLPDGRHVFR